MNTAQQIAADIREAIKPAFVPACIELRLEAIIDANLAGERAKVAALVKAADEAEKALGILAEAHEQGDEQYQPGGWATDALKPLRAALFDLQA